MPVYLNVFNLIINKTAIYEKYAGGVEQFRIDYKIPLSKINHEDDELFSLGQMNADEFDIDSLKSTPPKREIQPKGRCYFCKEPFVDKSQIFCDSDCSSDYSQEQKQKAQKLV